jgi:two-component system, cell cycle sensor histidine kinase and response regulator CckA
MRNITDKVLQPSYYNGSIVKITSPVNLSPTALDTEGERVPTVLVVDDEPIVRNMVRLALSAEGYMVLDATGAAELAALCLNLGEEQIDLLIIDHGLKPDNGRVIAESLVRFTPVPKVLIISGSIFNTVQDEDGIPPGSSFLQKPFTPQQLLSTVAALLFPSTH